MQQQAGAIEVVVTPGHRAGAGTQAPGKLADHGLLRNQSGILLVGDRVQGGEKGLVVGEHQVMAVRAVLMVPGNAFFAAQSLNQREVAFEILSAVFARWAGADMKGKGISLDAMFLEHLGNDLWHGQLLENSLVVAELQVVQRRHQGQLVTGQALTGVSDPHIFDPPMQAFAIQAKAQKRRLAEKAFKIKVGVLADQFNLDCVQAAEGFRAFKRQDLEIIANRGNQ
ncbi:hypothetical protein D3C72_1411210 [compost metagenome]